MKLIVAVDENWGIGCDNGLLYSIPGDKAYFRAMTTGRAVVMGRATFDSLPGGKPLKDRINIVLTRDTSLSIPGVLTCNPQNRLANLLRYLHEEDVFIAGGHSIYAQLMDYCSLAYVTMIYAKAPADRFFPDIGAMPNWVLQSESETRRQGGLAYCFRVYANTTVKDISGLEL